MGIQNNGRCVLALRSVTYAMRAKELLSGYGISCSVVTLDSSLSKKGCANGIELSCRNVQRAEKVLNNACIPISGKQGETQ